MGRRAESYRVAARKDGCYRIRFTFGGKRYSISTGHRDRELADVEARRIFHAVTSGQEHKRRVAKTGLEVKDVAGHWIASLISTAADTSVPGYKSNARLWVAHFGMLDRMTKPAVANYVRKRLEEVTRRTIVKELSAMRSMLSWCADENIPALSPDDVKAPRRTVTGTRWAGRNAKRGNIILTTAQARALLASVEDDNMRARFTVMYETGLRNSTLSKLSAPDDYEKGARELVIPPEADKARFGRTIDLSPAARRALDSVCPKSGLIFGKHSKVVRHLRRAAALAGLPAKICRWLSPYDFRHTRLTMWGESGSLMAVGYMAGHKNASTTSRYMHPGRDAAKRLVSGPKRGPKRGGPNGKTR